MDEQLWDIEIHIPYEHPAQHFNLTAQEVVAVLTDLTGYHAGAWDDVTVIPSSPRYSAHDWMDCFRDA